MTESYYAARACPLGHNDPGLLHQNASIPSFLIQEQGHLGEGCLKDPFVVKDGFIELPQGPGLDIELDKEALADKIGHDGPNAHSFHPEDGSAVD